MHDEVRAAKRELERLSATDGLTGLYNYRYLHARLREEFRRAERHHDPLALIMADLNGFKALNDTYGYPFGEEVLRVVARSLVEAVRETDLVAHYGRDEFVVLLPRTPSDGALSVAERTRGALCRVRVEGRPVQARVAASLGVSAYPAQEANSPEGLLRLANEALYRSKRAGRDQVSR